MKKIKQYLYLLLSFLCIWTKKS